MPNRPGMRDIIFRHSREGGKPSPDVSAWHILWEMDPRLRGDDGKVA
jgi:hypothetical protein